MRCLLIGTGSIGKRHVRVLQSLGSFEIVALRSTGKRLDDWWDGKLSAQVRSFPDAFTKPVDFAIVANPTKEHIAPARELARRGVPFLLEKPVGANLNGVAGLLRDAERSKTPVLVGYQMRHHPGYAVVTEAISSGEIGRPLCCTGYVGQYLPEWRPGTDYRDSYSAKPSLGGGVLLDLSHELDLVRSLMGDAVSVSATWGRISDLEIETEDFADVILTHERGASAVHLDYLSREYVWRTRVSGEKGTVDLGLREQVRSRFYGGQRGTDLEGSRRF